MPNSLNSHFVSYEETFNQNNVQIYELLKLLSYFESFFFKVVDWRPNVMQDLRSFVVGVGE